MPVKKRLAKVRAQRITPEAVASYSSAMRTLDVHIKHMRGAPCGGDGRSHCPRCVEHNEAVVNLHEALALHPWNESPVYADPDDDPPDWMAAFPDRVADFRSAQELRRQLDEAAS